MATIRAAFPDDIPAINNIHRHYVQKTVITFITEPNTDETMLANYHKVKEQGLPYLVAIDGSDKNIVGYIYVSPFRGVKPGYRHTLEMSLFVHPGHVRMAIGQKLLNTLIKVLTSPGEWAGYYEGNRLFDSPPKQLMAVMSVDVDMPGKGFALRDWYVKQGFEQRAHLKEVGWKKERWIDTIYLQKTLRE